MTVSKKGGSEAQRKKYGLHRYVGPVVVHTPWMAVEHCTSVFQSVVAAKVGRVCSLSSV